ncbi:hypothetical protein HC928_00520 [bacterium]|nr:hypothetical protein [bacterium]
MGALQDAWENSMLRQFYNAIPDVRAHFTHQLMPNALLSGNENPSLAQWLPGVVYNNAGMWSEEARENIHKAREGANYTVHGQATTPNASWINSVMNYGAELMLPAPIAPIQRAGQVVRGALGGGKMGAVGDFATQLVGSSMIPFRQMRSPGGVTVEAAIPITMDEGIAQLGGQNPLYQDGPYRPMSLAGGPSVVGQVQASEPAQANTPDLAKEFSAFAKSLSAGEQSLEQAAMTPQEPAWMKSFESQLGGAGNAPFGTSTPQSTAVNEDFGEQVMSMLRDEEEERDTRNKTLLFGAAGVGAAAAIGAIVTRGRYRAKQAAKLAQAGDYTGVKMHVPLTGTKTKLKQAFVDQFGSIGDSIRKSAIEQGMSPQAAQNVTDEIMAGWGTRGTTQSMAKIIANFLETKELPFTRVAASTTKTTDSIADLETAMARLSKEQVDKVTDALIAGNVLDHPKVRKQGFWSGSTRGLPGPSRVTVAELQKSLTDAMSDPVVARIVNGYRDNFRTLLRFAHDHGAISTKDYGRMVSTNPNFVPFQLNAADTDLLPFGLRMKAKLQQTVDKLKLLPPDRDDDDIVKAFAHLMKKNMDIPPGALINPALLAEQYASQMIRKVMINDLRRDFLKYAAKDAHLQGWVRKATSDRGENIIIVMDGGKPQYFQVLDDHLRTALQKRPLATIGILDSIKRVYTALTTGIAAPQFAPVSALYDVLTTAVTRTKGYNATVLDHVLKRAGLPTWSQTIGDATGIPDPTIVLSPIVGTAGYLKDAFVKATARNLRASLVAQNGAIFDALGPAKTQMLADKMTSAYMNSVTHYMSRFGAESTVFLENKMVDSIGSLTADIAPAFLQKYSGSVTDRIRSTALVRGYETAIRSVHMSTKWMYARANLDKDWFTKLEKQNLMGYEQHLTKLARETRQMSADTTRSGSGAAYRMGIASHIAYANTTVQVLARYARAFKEQPRHTFTAIGTLLGSIALYYNDFAMNNPEAFQKWMLSTTPAQRGRMIPFYDLDGTLLHTFPLAQEFRPFVSMMIEGMNMVTGWGGGELSFEQQQNMALGIRQGFTSQIPLHSPVIAAVGALGGFDWGSFAEGRYIDTPLYGEKVSVERESRVLDSAISKEMDGFIRAIGGATMSHILEGAYTAEAIMKRGDTSELDAAMRTAGEAITAASKWSTDPMLRTITQSELVGLDRTRGTYDGMSAFVREASEQIRLATRQFSDVRSPANTGATNTSQQREFVLPEVLRGTPAAHILQRLHALSKDVATHEDQVGQLHKNRDEARINPAYITDVNSYRRYSNEINEKITAHNRSMAHYMQAAEEQINDELAGMGITKHFNIRKFDLKEWIDVRPQ